MSEHAKTSYKVVATVAKHAHGSTLVKGKSPTKLGIPTKACHVTAILYSCLLPLY